jgi:methylthioribose-1-phosphate isomerase
VVEAGKRVHVYADETRPRLQGARLTAWELMKDGIPVTLIADNMAATLMRQGKIDCVITGAVTIAANGDTANKIGTYSIAVLARAHGIPMYVAAPMTTVNLAIPSGDAIVIEERSPEEMTLIEGQRIAPDGVQVINPAFDVTPAEFITAIITEEGVLRPPYPESLAGAAKRD